MGFKLAAVMAALLVVLFGAFYAYYNDTQERMGVLRENNAKLEVAVQTAEDSMNLMKDEMTRNAELMKDLNVKLQKAEAYGDELRAKFSRYNLVQEALKNPEKLEGSMNGATAKLWRSIEKDTGGAGDKPLPDWLQSESVEQGSRARGEGSDQVGENSNSDGSTTEASSAD